MKDNSVSSNGFPGSLTKDPRRALSVTAFLAALAVGLLFLLPGGLVWAQDAGTIEYAEDRTDPVTTYTAMDPEQTAITSWTLAGTDADAFTIEGGVLRFAKSLDYENPTDVQGTSPSTAAAMDNSYEITIKAMDSTGKAGEKAVTVEVIDVDEAGTVTLSARRPLVGVAVTASLADLDGTVTNDTWQWAKSRSKNGSYTDIENAEAETYTPTDATGKSDVGYYLRATVSYTDPEGSGKSAMMKSEYTVQATRESNNAPKFADDQDPVMDNDQADAAREVAENTAAGTDIGAPVVATDEDDDVLTYTLTGNDAASFDIDWATGQLMTKVALNFEITPTYTVVVRATDPAGVPQESNAVPENSDVVTVIITIADVNEPPAITGDAAVTFDETAGNIDGSLDDYAADDPETNGSDNTGVVTWSVAGLDGGKFTATGGELKFKAKPDYENATDANTDNVYEVTVQATDANGNRGMKKVKVTVMNEDEVGTVTLSKTQPRVGIAVTASLTDPDDSISSLTWQWSNSGGAIPDANSDTYTPVGQRGDDANGDVGDTLTATASYTDGHGPGKTAAAGSANMVALDTRNKPPAFVDQDAETDGLQNDMATRKVDENTEADATDDQDADDVMTDNVGGVVMATDPDPNAETPTYTLGGADAAKFRVRDNGQIEVGAGTMLDYETKQTYMVTVMAEDSFGSSSSIDVTIMVNPIDEAPDVSGAEATEYAEDRTDPVTTYTAMDPEQTAITSWTLAGTDADAFTIEGGVLRFAKSLDYENPTDVQGTSPSTAAAMDNSYEITIKAMDSTGKAGEKAVTVEVIDVDEAGTVTLSARRPLVGVAVTASLADLDGTVTNDTWQWAKSRSKNGSYTDIENAEAETYTPTDATGKSDVGYYLRATVSYTDPEGSGKSAMMKSEYTVQATRESNNAPKFADDQDPVMDNDQADAAREVAENTAAGTDIGAPVVATDEDDDVLTYTLTGNDAASFDIDWATGQLMTKVALNFEITPTYTVVVRATDPAGVPQESNAVPENSDVVTVIITIADVNEPPAITGDAAVTFDETAGNIDGSLDDYAADDPETNGSDNTGVVTWSVAGLDGGKFTATGGELKFKAKPDYENATDANTDNVYEVTVQATDANGNRGMKKVKVTVMNEDEVGTVTLSKTQPRVGIAVTASLTDPDDSISSLTWQWSNSGGAIPDANSDTYTPVGQRGDDANGDVGDTLTATASYTDGHGPGKTAAAGSANMVALDTRNKPPAFVDQDAETDGLQNDMATRKVDENTEADATDDQDADDVTTDNVGGVVMATDPDPNAETPTYTLGGADAAKFRVRDNGQIEVGAGTMLDYETKQTYMVTITADDSFGSSSSIMVTIEVNPIDEAPVISVGGLAISGKPSVDYDEKGIDAVETYTASGPNAAMATWSLSGLDALDFTITGGVLAFTAPPDFENPADADTDNMYDVTVEADDGTYMDTRAVTVTVTNVDEPGAVSLSSQAPVVGTALTASLTDDDGSQGDTLPVTDTEIDTADITWVWEVSKVVQPSLNDDYHWGEAPGDGAETGVYTPSADDVNKYLRVVASYTDGEGSGKSEIATSANVVTAADTRDPLLAEYDPNADGVIEKADMRLAVADYFGQQPTLTKPDMRRLVAIYFS